MTKKGVAARAKPFYYHFHVSAEMHGKPPIWFPSFIQEFIQNIPEKGVSVLVFLLLLVLVDLEVAQLVALFAVSHDAQPVTEVVLLQVLLGQVLQIPAGKGHGSCTRHGLPAR